MHTVSRRFLLTGFSATAVCGLAGCATAPVRSTEIDPAFRRTEVDYAHQIENYDARADLIGMMATYFEDPNRVLNWLEPYRMATADDLKRVVQMYLVPENRVTSIYVPEVA